MSSPRLFSIHSRSAMPMPSISVKSSNDFYRASGQQEASRAISDLAQVGVVEDANLAAVVWQAAGTLKARLRRVSLADCFAIELAERLQAIILTADHREFDVLAGQPECRVRFIR